MSFFPFATPMLMVARLAVPPGIPWWEPVLGVLGVLATTVLCVYAAGRIFRVGILMQGKGARFGEMVKWVFRG
jgi:ABC-2 type transport system permease protein